MAANNFSRDTKWADGLRGIASLVVVTAHVARSLAPTLLSPAQSATLPPTLLQLPFIRCLFMGRASVAVFAILSGYVNALKPIRQMRAGQTDAGLSMLSKSAFRRTGRFMIPAMVTTVLSWLLCQFGAYRLAKTVASAWIRDTSPSPSSSFVAAFYDLFRSLVGTWTTGGNEYDKIQWTLPYLLKGSFFVYLSLFATIFVQPRFRMFAFMGMYAYYWALGDAVIGINIYFGLLLAELTFEPRAQALVERRPMLISFVSSIVMIVGLFLVSYPEEKPEWAQWSTTLNSIGHHLFPRGSEYSRFYPGLGADMICLGILFNSNAKKMLSSSYFCWLGKMSFAIYLTHAPLIRTLLTWMLYGFSTRPGSPGNDKDGHPLPPGWVPTVNVWAMMVLVPLWYVIVYRIAGVWVRFVDPWCGRVTNWIEEMAFREESKTEKVPLPA